MTTIEQAARAIAKAEGVNWTYLSPLGIEMYFKAARAAFRIFRSLPSPKRSEDTERLDWLIKQECRVLSYQGKSWCSWPDAWSSAEKTSDEKKGARAAIDAARRAEKRGKKR